MTHAPPIPDDFDTEPPEAPPYVLTVFGPNGQEHLYLNANMSLVEGALLISANGMLLEVFAPGSWIRARTEPING